MKNKDIDFVITRVVTRDLVTDSFQGIRNLFGLRLRGYENRIQKSIEEMIEEMRLRYSEIKWYRIDTDQLTKSGVMIILYGLASGQGESNE